MKIAIHQPNFFPYYPFFQKMAEVDVFVIMINCQFEKNNYQNRFEYDGWNTMSVNAGLEPIKNKRYVNHKADWNKIVTKYPKLNQFSKYISPYMAFTNIAIIMKLAEMLSIDTRIEMDYGTDLSGTDRLVDICQTYEATEYLSGISGKKYLDVSKFGNIKVNYQDESKMVKKSVIQMI